MVYLEIINDIINNNNKCNKQLQNCKCVNNIQNNTFKYEISFILNIIHCYLYHYNEKNCKNDELLQTLRDTIMDYNKNLNIINNINIKTVKNEILSVPP